MNVPGATGELITANLSGGDDDDGQRPVRPADPGLDGLEALDQRDGVGQRLTCTDGFLRF